MTTTSPEDRGAIVARIARAIHERERFVITSHVRPDGDAIGSAMAMAWALRALGKSVEVVNRDATPAPLAAFPGAADIRVADRIEGEFDAGLVMECPDLSRTGVAGLERLFLINIDHHPGNTGYGALNWFDGSAAACAEMVFDLVAALGVPLSVEIATHLYVGILTDTGSFHYSSISARTFDICRQLVEAGVEPPRIARQVFDSNTVGRLRIFADVLGTLAVEHGGRLAVLYVNEAMAEAAGASYDDTEGLINLPLTVPEIRASVFLKGLGTSQQRVSLRSKGDVDVAAVAKRFGGGGHRNAAGCTVDGTFAEAREAVVAALGPALAPERTVGPAA